MADFFAGWGLPHQNRPAGRWGKPHPTSCYPGQAICEAGPNLAANACVDNENLTEILFLRAGVELFSQNQ